MNTAWSENFTYKYLSELLKIAKKKFHIRLLGEGLSRDRSDPQLFVRHDVDISITAALKMAVMEADQGVQSTYMFIPHSRLYDIQRDRSLVRRFGRLNHEVALHFDVDERKRFQNAAISQLLNDIEQDCELISQITGEPVRSVSFHRPMPEFLRGDLLIGGRLNAYSAVLMESYISDSRGEWRNGAPIPYLQATRSPVVQLLIHPIWWGDTHIMPCERLEEFYLEATIGLSSAARARFDSDLVFTIPGVRRSKYREA